MPIKYGSPVHKGEIFAWDFHFAFLISIAFLISLLVDSAGLLGVASATPCLAACICMYTQDTF